MTLNLRTEEATWKDAKHLKAKATATTELR